MTEHHNTSSEKIDDMTTNQLTALRIKEERNRLNYTQQSVADHIGLDLSTYSRLENGKIEITITKLEAIAEFLKVPIVNLLPSNLHGSININNGTAIINGNGTFNNTVLDSNGLQNSIDQIIEKLEKLKSVV